MPSSVIRRFEHDETTGVMRVVFQSGDVYDYFGVPAELAAEWRAAFSKGRFFGTHIRDAFPYRRLGRTDGLDQVSEATDRSARAVRRRGTTDIPAG